jgi:hypothetical protein
MQVGGVNLPAYDFIGELSYITNRFKIPEQKYHRENAVNYIIALELQKKEGR